MFTKQLVYIIIAFCDTSNILKWLYHVSQIFMKRLYLDLEDGSTPKVEHSSPLLVAKQPDLKVERVKTDPRDVYQRTKDMKQELLNRVEEIGVYLPNNTLDELIDCLGGPSQVIIHIFTPHHSNYANDTIYQNYISRI